MPEQTKTFTRETVERNIANYERSKGKNVGRLTPADIAKSLRYWKYILSRMGNRNEVTLPESVLNEKAK